MKNGVTMITKETHYVIKTYFFVETTLTWFSEFINRSFEKRNAYATSHSLCMLYMLADLSVDVYAYLYPYQNCSRSNQLMVAYFSWVVLCFWMPCCYLVPLWLSRRQPRWRRIGTGQSQLLSHYTCIWVRSIAKPGNKTVTVPWPARNETNFDTIEKNILWIIFHPILDFYERKNMSMSIFDHFPVELFLFLVCYFTFLEV